MGGKTRLTGSRCWIHFITYGYVPDNVYGRYVRDFGPISEVDWFPAIAELLLYSCYFSAGTIFSRVRLVYGKTQHSFSDDCRVKQYNTLHHLNFLLLLPKKPENYLVEVVMENYFRTHIA